MTWHGMTWYGMAWYVKAWHNIIKHGKAGYIIDVRCPAAAVSNVMEYGRKEVFNYKVTVTQLI